MILIYFFFIKTEIVGIRKNCRGEGVLMSTHNVCFGSKIRQNLPLYTPVLLYKSGVQGGILFMDVFLMKYVLKVALLVLYWLKRVKVLISHNHKGIFYHDMSCVKFGI